jgi:hypothetical protein
MNFKLMVARTLVSIAISSSPAMATEVVNLHHPNACHYGNLTSDNPKAVSHAAQALSALRDAAPGTHKDDWPANLILG